MARLFQSISFKIFGVSVCLLLMMVGAAAWSARATEEVHTELKALAQSIFPLSVTLAKLNTVVQSQKVTADYLTTTPDETSVAVCLSQAKSQAERADVLLAQAVKYRAIGAKIAVMERNQLAMARLEPMIQELVYQEKRLSQLTIRACELRADAVQMNEAKVQADEMLRHSEAIADEINTFVETDARIVTENQLIAMQANFLMITSAAMVGIMLAWLVSRGLTRPIMRLQAGARAVGAGLLDQAHVPVTSQDEIGDVTHAFNAMIVD